MPDTTYAIDTAHRIGMICGLTSIAAGLICIIVVLIARYRADVNDTDRTLRDAGHEPPETDPERTLMLPVVRAPEDLAEGTHSKRVERTRFKPYRGKHHERFGCVLASVLLAREGVTA
jgi:hypothetical protein